MSTSPSPTLQASISEGFPEWLQQQNISLAFTTYQTNRLFCVGTTSSDRLALQERLFDKPMGLFAREDSLYMSTRYQIWQLDNLLAKGETRNGCDCAAPGLPDRLYFPKLASTTGDLNVHDVVLDGSGELLFVNTDFSCLARLSPNYSFEPVWQPPFISKLVAEDRCHLNGLALRDGSPAYMTACSATDKASGWRNCRRDGGIVLDLESNEIVIQGLSMPHSPRWYKGKLWLLNSGTGELGYGDLESGSFVPLTFCPGFVRGLAFWHNYAFVGLSKVRSNPMTGLDLSDRLAATGNESHCGLMLIDLDRGKTIHWLHLEGVVEELFDIVVLPGVRQPEALGFQSDEIQRLVTFPGSEGIVVTKPTVKRPSLGDTTPIPGVPQEVWDQDFAAQSNKDSERRISPPLSADALASLKFQQVYSLTPHNLVDYDEFTFPSLQQRWLTQPQRGELFGASASVAGEMVAFAIAEQLPAGSAEIISLFVAPTYRRNGIGTKLIAYLELGLRQEGSTSIAVNFQPSLATRMALEPLLRKLGYSETAPTQSQEKRWQKILQPTQAISTPKPKATSRVRSLRAARSWAQRTELPTTSSTQLAVNPAISAISRVRSQRTELPISQPTALPISQPTELPTTSSTQLAVSPAISEETSKPKVSLVMTVYNTQAYLREALDSLLAQTFTDWELILWDDGSTDESIFIARTYSQRDPRIRFHPQAHWGRVKALQQAHSLTRGEYVGWLDADDRLAPTALEETVKFLDTYPDYGMVYTNYLEMDVQGKVLGLGHFCQTPYRRHQLIFSMLTFHFRLLRQTVFEAVGGINGEFESAEDYDLCLRVEEASRIYHLQRPLYFYRLNPASITHQQQSLQRQWSERAVNEALERRGMLRIYQLEKNGEEHQLRRREEYRIYPIPEAAKTQFLQGQQLAQEGSLEAAATCFQAAIQLHPNYLAAYNQLGNTYQRLGQTERATATYQNLLELDPNLAQAHCNLGAIWQRSGKIQAALKAYQRAVDLKPDFGAAQLNLARLLASQGKQSQTVIHYQAAIAAKPQEPEAHYGLALAFFSQRDLEAAIPCFQQVLVLQPHHPEALFNLGLLYEARGELEASLDCYQQLGDRHPQWVNLVALQLNYVRRQLCDWQDYHSRITDLLRGIETHCAETENPPLLPLSLSLFPASPKLHLAVNQDYAARTQRNVAEIQQRVQFHYPEGKAHTLRIGYVSPDFLHHPVGLLVQDLFPYHNREQFTIFAYSLHSIEDEVQANIKAGCDVFVDCSTQSPEETARRINQDGIHILIDLAGYTTYCRPEIFALRPAPIQCSYLGYPDTTGAPWMDYLLTDKWVVPPELAPHCSEEVIYLPHQFAVPSQLAQSSQTQTPLIKGGSRGDPSRQDYGLPPEGFVFCCFNLHRKIEPKVFATWMRILQQVPDALLWLRDGPDRVKANLRQSAASQGIKPERLIFAPHLPFQQYLARYSLADLFLDTFNYSAGSTGVCALGAGVPLLTQLGNTNASRMGASLCAAAGLESLICNSIATYEEKAVHLATHRKELAGIRQKLQNNRETLPLFQPQQLVAHLEAIFQKLVAVDS